jgi:adenylate kinase
LGPQGSGKGTQAELIAKKYNLEHIDVGKTLRAVAERETALGKQIYEIQNVQRALVPSKILQEVLHTKLNSLPREAGLIIDGAPRTVNQIEYIQAALQEVGRKIDKVIFVNIPKTESIERISRRFLCEKCRKYFIMGKDIQSVEEKCPICQGKIIQRIDDTPEGVAKRLEIFDQETIPVINFFKEKGKVLEIDGLKTIEEVFGEIVKGIQSLQ